MKKIKVVSLCAVALIGLNVGGVAFAGTNGDTIKSSGKIEFIPNDEPTSPVDPDKPDPENPVKPIDPVDPDGKPQPGTNGPLSLDFASSFDFGQQKISNKSKTYYAKSQKFEDIEQRANYAQITDNRGNSKGWTLRVKQDAPFKTDKAGADYPTLNGTTINIKGVTATTTADNPTKAALAHEGVLKVDNDKVGDDLLIMDAAESAGSGTWVSRFGKVLDVPEDSKTPGGKDVNDGVTLDIPGAVGKSAAVYTTTLTWTLSDTPATIGN